MNFQELLKTELRFLGRSLTARETEFLRAAEAAGFDMEIEYSPKRGLHFLLETVPEDPMAYPLTAGVRAGTLDLLFADTDAIRKTIRRLIHEIRES